MTATAEFIPLDSPQFVTLDLDHVHTRFETGEWDDIVRPGEIVRLRYTATREQEAAIDKKATERELLAAGAARVDFRPNIIREARTRAAHLTENLTELDALAAYTDAQGIEAGLRDRMLARTSEWLA